MTSQNNDKTVELNAYRLAVEREMIKMGASKSEIALIKDATIQNARKRKRTPEDVAYAILQ